MIPTVENDLLHEDIHQRDLELYQLKKEIEKLKAENEEIKSQNPVEMNILNRKLINEAEIAKNAYEAELEKAKQTYKVCIQQSKKDLEEEIEEMKKKCKNHAREITDLRFSLQLAEESANNFRQQRDEANKQALEWIIKIESLEEEWRAQNINIFKAALERFGCKLAWYIPEKFTIFYNDSGGIKHNGGVRYKNRQNKRCVRVYDFDQEMCFMCLFRRGRCRYLK